MSKRMIAFAAVFCLIALPLLAHAQEKSHETKSEIPQLTAFHEVIYEIWHTAYPAKDGKPELIIHGDSMGILESNPAQEFASWLFVRWLSMPEQQIQIAQANPGLPVSQSILDHVSANRSAQWKQVVAFLDTAKSAPRTAEWRVARFVLQDATYQIFLANITPDQYPQIIGLLDTIISDLRDQPATLGWE